MSCRSEMITPRSPRASKGYGCEARPDRENQPPTCQERRIPDAIASMGCRVSDRTSRCSRRWPP
jgi:hypothetical protein